MIYTRHPNDNRMLQHLGKCLKTIMTHQVKQDRKSLYINKQYAKTHIVYGYTNCSYQP